MDDTDDNLDTVLQEFADIGAEPPNKRQLCPKCSRPMRVCWCPHLTERLIETKSRVVILQHPNEEKRCLRTAKILELSLASGRCLVIRGKRFTSYKYPVLKELIDGQSVMTTNGCETIARKTVVVYPGVGSQSLTDSFIHSFTRLTNIKVVSIHQKISNKFDIKSIYLFIFK